MAEVVAPGERVYYLNRKVCDFARAGVPLIWVVHPDIRVVDVYAAGRWAYRLTDTDTLTGDPVLPGFRVPVADLFPPASPAS